MKNLPLNKDVRDEDGQPLAGLILALPLSIVAWAIIGGIVHSLF